MTYMSQGGYCSSGNCCSNYSRTNFNNSGIYNPNISNLETAVRDYAPIMAHTTRNNDYSSSIKSVDYKANSKDYLISQPFSPEPFLRPLRPASPFIGNVNEISHYVSETFEAVTNSPLPNDVTIEIVSAEELKKKHEELGGKWNIGIQGFSVNKQGFCSSIIVIKQNELDKMMITIGHELGHILTFTLNNQIDEEAKAFAFEMAWIKAMHENNIANLALSLNTNPMPANNGLHDVAFKFVKEQLDNGKNPVELFREISKRKIKASQE